MRAAGRRKPAGGNDVAHQHEPAADVIANLHQQHRVHVCDARRDGAPSLKFVQTGRGLPDGQARRGAPLGCNGRILKS